ncbi:hypothetical protein ES703_00334 [subsurface metagenome]
MVMNRGHALSRDELIRVLTAYTGITTANGAADGTTLIDNNLIGSNDFITEKTILIGSGIAAREDKGAASFNAVNGTITLQGTGFNSQILAGTIYRIINISSIEIDVAAIDTKIGTNTDPAGTTTLFAWLANIFAGAGGITAIFALVNAILVLTETGGTVTATGPGTEDNVYINDAPAGVFRPIIVTLDTSDLAGGETITVRTRYRIRAGGTARLKGAPVIFAGVQAEPMKDIELTPNRFGIIVTIEGSAGVVFDWEVHSKD